MADRKFQINPGPLKVVPASRRKPLATFSDFADLGRCEERLKDGSGRCTRDGVELVNGRELCRQHAKLTLEDTEERTGDGD